MPRPGQSDSCPVLIIQSHHFDTFLANQPSRCIEIPFQLRTICLKKREVQGIVVQRAKTNCQNHDRILQPADRSAGLFGQDRHDSPRDSMIKRAVGIVHQDRPVSDSALVLPHFPKGFWGEDAHGAYGFKFDQFRIAGDNQVSLICIGY